MRYGRLSTDRTRGTTWIGDRQCWTSRNMWPLSFRGLGLVDDSLQVHGNSPLPFPFVRGFEKGEDLGRLEHRVEFCGQCTARPVQRETACFTHVCFPHLSPSPRLHSRLTPNPPTGRCGGMTNNGLRVPRRNCPKSCTCNGPGSWLLPCRPGRMKPDCILTRPTNRSCWVPGCLLDR